MHTVSILAPPPQFAVVILTTDPRTPEQYDGLVATQQKTVAASKGKGKAVATVNDESDYGQSSSEEEQELEEGESAAQRFQHVQQNKKLTSKKANAAKPGMENTWQEITFNYAFRMHWQTLFGFALCWALCANSAAKSSVVRRLALVMAQPGMYHEAVASYNAAFPERPLVAQYGSHLNILQVHVPDDQAHNFSDDNTLCVLLHNRILLDWVDHAYTYGMVYLEQQFHNPTMSMDIFKDVDNKHIEHVSCYGTPPAIPQWDGWREMMENNHYCLMFKRTEEHLLPVPPEATGLYYYIGMDPNQVHLWKQTAAHSMLPSVPTATNIALTELSMVETMAMSGPLTPLRTKSVPHECATNIAIGDMAMTLELGEGLEGNMGCEPLLFVDDHELL
ncbi:hypothetical protein C0995_010576 [Termitomyces sp. Mi166|nr:hypothetical protein C0995_010576 [Termitomyces sp. Mi166\